MVQRIPTKQGISISRDMMKLQTRKHVKRELKHLSHEHDAIAPSVKHAFCCSGGLSIQLLCFRNATHHHIALKMYASESCCLHIHEHFE